MSNPEHARNTTQTLKEIHTRIRHILIFESGENIELHTVESNSRPLLYPKGTGLDARLYSAT